MYLLLMWVVVSFLLGHIVGLLINYGLISAACGQVCISIITIMGCALGGWIGVQWARRDRDLKRGAWAIKNLP